MGTPRIRSSLFAFSRDSSGVNSRRASTCFLAALVAASCSGSSPVEQVPNGTVPSFETTTSVESASETTDTNASGNGSLNNDQATSENIEVGAQDANSTSEGIDAVEVTDTSDLGASETAGDTTNSDGVGGVAEPAPSAGCSAGGEGLPPDSLVSTPNGYDGSTPLPLVMAFHAAGNNNDQLQRIFGSEGTGRDYLMVFPKSQGNGWNLGADRTRFEMAHDYMLENYCVDTSRIFAVGHSSGAQFITQLLCDGEQRFRGVAPVASSRYCQGWDSVPAIVIHGLDDIERGGQGVDPYNIDDADGAKDVAVYRDSNGCEATGAGFTPTGGNCPGNVNPGCQEFQGCSAETQFCNHNDPQYGTSNHGVPCFGPSVVFDFFDRVE